jgi:hypothetical protein
MPVTSELRRYALERWPAGLRLRVHGTPQQLANDKKAFVRIEHALFVEQMTVTGAPGPTLEEDEPDVAPTRALPLLDLRNHYFDEEPSMLNHFRLLREF